jgi:hypothetical protein
MSLRFPSDDRLVRLQLQLAENDPIPDGIEEEYEKRITMMHHCGNTGPLNAGEIMGMLRFLGLEPPRRVSKSQETRPADWRSVTKGTRVIARCDDRGQMQGFFRGARGSGIVSVEIPGQDPPLQTFFAKDVVLDIGQLTDIPKEAKRKDPQWDDVPLGTPLVVINAKGKRVNAVLGEIGPGNDELTVVPEGGDGESIVVKRSNAAVHEEAALVSL